MARWLGCLPALFLCVVREAASMRCLSSGEFDRESLHVVGHGTDSPTDQPVFSNNPPPTPSGAALPRLALKKSHVPESLLLLNNKKTLPLCLCWVHGPTWTEWITDTSGWSLGTYCCRIKSTCFQMAAEPSCFNVSCSTQHYAISSLS